MHICIALFEFAVRTELIGEHIYRGFRLAYHLRINTRCHQLAVLDLCFDDVSHIGPYRYRGLFYAVELRIGGHIELRCRDMYQKVELAFNDFFLKGVEGLVGDDEAHLFARLKFSCKPTRFVEHNNAFASDIAHGGKHNWHHH